MSKRTIQELQALQALPLSVKVEKTKLRIKEWVDRYGEDGVYVSFSGGKDSTVLLHIAREIYPDMKAVFIDTGLEYPEIREFVKTFDNVDWVKPKMNFRQVIEQYGYPFISKEVSECVYGARKYLSFLIDQNTSTGGVKHRHRGEKVNFTEGGNFEHSESQFPPKKDIRHLNTHKTLWDGESMASSCTIQDQDLRNLIASRPKARGRDCDSPE